MLEIVGASLVASLGTAGYARRVEPKWLDVSQVTIPVPDLPAHLAGRRFGQLSDIHLSPFTSPEHLESAIDMVNAQAPEWLFLTGDYVSRETDYAAELVPPLRRLDMPAYSVWGNHDQWTSTAHIGRYFAEAGTTVLRNTGIHLDTGLYLAGSDNIWGGRPDLPATLNNMRPGDTTILLMHEPDYFDQVIAQDAPVHLQLSGHTHGGQVRLPRLSADPSGYRSWAPVLPRYGTRYPMGLRKLGQRYVYTNRGLGVWPVRFRFNCRPELTIFTLEQA